MIKGDSVVCLLLQVGSKLELTGGRDSYLKMKNLVK